MLGIVSILIFEIVNVLISDAIWYAHLISVFYIGAYLWAMYLNYKRKWKQARFMVVLFCYLGVISQHMASEETIASWVFFICMFAFLGAIFQHKRSIIGYGLVLLALILGSMYIKHTYPHNAFDAYDPKALLPLNLTIYATTSCFVLVIMVFVRENLNRHQKQLEKLLDERNLLLREVHHRVKNNLQVVSSLLNLQKRRLPPESMEITRNMIASSQTRIQAMAYVHQLLYDSADLIKIDLKNYIEQLVGHLQELYAGNSAHIDVSITIRKCSVSLEKAVPLGLIITEALTNSFKYAFQGTERAKICLTYDMVGGNNQLVISDNGVGMVNNSQKQCLKKGIGIQLIRDMASQLNAGYQSTIVNGVTHVLTFYEG